MNCLKCGKEVNQKPGKREKRFCSDSCRAGYSQQQKAAEKKIIPHSDHAKTKPDIFPELPVSVPETMPEGLGWKEKIEWRRIHNTKK